MNDHRRTSHRGLMLHKKASQSDSDNLPEIHVCDICGKKLRNKLNVLRHKQSFHNEENPFRCKICDNRFKTQISLRRHEKTHDKPRYKCEVGHAKQVLIYSRLSLSRIPRDSLKYFEISVVRHIRFAELRKK